jgi:aminoglycoside phosphotransferase (APT) family kinase protein
MTADGGPTQIDLRAVLSALGVSDATTAVPVQGGWDTSIWRVERPDGVSALRLFRVEQAAVCRREVVAMRAAESAGLPVPRIRAEGAWQGRPALLLSWCAGRPLGDELRARPWLVWRRGLAFGRMQARIHAVPAPDPLRRDPDAWIGWAGPDETGLHARLRELAPRADALLHLDYHPLNVLTDRIGNLAVLDWANARAGDPRADLARTLAILRLSPGGSGALAVPIAVLLRILERAWRRGYLQVAGPVRQMAPFYAWAGAVMMRDLTPKLGRPGLPLEPRHLDAIRHWTAVWKRRAGISP